VGGLAGAMGLQMASERCVDLFAPDVCFSCKKYEVFSIILWFMLFAFCFIIINFVLADVM
jgi:hypothetical protein